MRVQVSGRTVKLWASANDTYDWAHGVGSQIGSSWPGSQLSGHRLYVEFSQGDLVDLTVDGRPDADLRVDELNAFTSDTLAGRLDPSHPDYDTLVARFQEEGFVKPVPKRKAAKRKPKSRSKYRGRGGDAGLQGLR